MPAGSVHADMEEVNAIGTPADGSNGGFKDASPGLPATPNLSIPCFMPAGAVRPDNENVNTTDSPTDRSHN